MELWIEKLKRYWLAKEINKIINLFDKDVLYYETPFNNITNLKEIWSEIKDQDIIKLDYKILNFNKNNATVNYILELSNKEIYDMVYYIELNNKNQCIYFKQWFMIKEGSQSL